MEETAIRGILLEALKAKPGASLRPLAGGYNNFVYALTDGAEGCETASDAREHEARVVKANTEKDAFRAERAALTLLDGRFAPSARR